MDRIVSGLEDRGQGAVAGALTDGHPFRRRKRQKEKGGGDEVLDQEINGNR